MYQYFHGLTTQNPYICDKLVTINCIKDINSKLTTMKKNIANSMMRWALVVLIAFAMPSVASAQFGKLKNTVKSTVKSETKEKTNSSSSGAPDFFKKKQAQSGAEAKAKTEEKEEESKSGWNNKKATDEDIYGANQFEEANKRKQEAAAKQAEEREARKKAGCKIVESRRDNQIGSWHGSENKMVSTVDGESYIFDAAAGVIRTESGKTVATINNGEMSIPSIDAKIKINSSGGITINGESCGKATRQDLYLYGRRFGWLSCEAPREMVTFFFLTQTPYGTPEARANMKRTQYMDGNFMDANGSRLGYIKGGAIFNNNRLYPKQGNMHYDDDETVIADTQYRVGAFQYDGTVNDNNGNKIGQVKDNGDILNVSGKKVAHVASDGKITDAAGKFLVQFSGDRPVAAAVAYWFFFKSKIR